MILILMDKLKRKFKINKKFPSKLIIHKARNYNQIKITNKMKTNIVKSLKKQNY